MDRLQQSIDRLLLATLCVETEVPKDLWILMDCLAAKGCPVKSILEGMVYYSEETKRLEQEAQVKELLKDVYVVRRNENE